MEAQLPQKFLRFIDHLERCDIHFAAIRDARRETGHGWLIPYGHIEQTSYGTNLTLAHSGLFERTTNAKLTGSSLAGAEIAIVILIDAIENIAQITLFRQRF